MRFKHVQVEHYAFVPVLALRQIHTLSVKGSLKKAIRNSKHVACSRLQIMKSVALRADLSPVNSLHTTLLKSHNVFPITGLLMCSLHEATHVTA
jgi:hypothetical protein